MKLDNATLEIEKLYTNLLAVSRLIKDRAGVEYIIESSDSGDGSIYNHSSLDSAFDDGLESLMKHRSMIVDDIRKKNEGVNLIAYQNNSGYCLAWNYSRDKTIFIQSKEVDMDMVGKVVSRLAMNNGKSNTD